VTTRAWVALAAFGWVGPWSVLASALAGGLPPVGAALAAAGITLAAFALAPQLALPLAAAAWTLLWGAAGWGALGHEAATALAGAPVPPALYLHAGTLAAWLACGWLIASAAAAQSSRDRLEREARRGMLAWAALGLALWGFAGPQRADLVRLFAAWLAADAAVTLVGLAATQAAEFELKFGRLRHRRPWWDALALSLAGSAAIAGAVVALGHAVLQMTVLAAIGRLLGWALTPLIWVFGLLAEALVWLLAWVRPQPAPPQRTAAPPPAPPPTSSAGPAGGALVGIEVFRGLVLAGALALAAVAWLLLRAQHRPERPEDPTWVEERAPWAGGGEAPRPGPRRRRQPAAAPTDVRLRQLFRRWLAWARRHGLPRLPAETAAEHLRRVLGTEPEGGAAAFLRAYEAVRYGATDSLTQDEVAAAEAGFADVMRRMAERGGTRA
jgi:hypothetical protein